MSLLYNKNFDAFLAVFAGAWLSRLHVDFITPTTSERRVSEGVLLLSYVASSSCWALFFHSP